MKITQSQAQRVATKLGIKFSKVKFTLKDFTIGMNIELEHRNITHGNLLMTGKIALAHLKEKWDYYRLLIKYVE